MKAIVINDIKKDSKYLYPIVLKTKEEADNFFKSRKSRNFEFISSEEKYGKYILTFKSNNKNELDDELNFSITSFYTIPHCEKQDDGWWLFTLKFEKE